MTLSDAVQHGHAYVTRLDGAVTGAIALYPPGAYPMTPARWWRQAFRIVRIAANTREHSLGIIRFGDVTSAGVPCDAWYVEALGVRPDLQRAGRGKLLMATVFALIDDAAGPSYLETTKPDNVGYYTALGYESVRSRVPLAADEGPWIFPMSRIAVGVPRSSVRGRIGERRLHVHLHHASRPTTAAVDACPSPSAPPSAASDLLAHRVRAVRAAVVRRDLPRVGGAARRLVRLPSTSTGEGAAYCDASPRACAPSDLATRYGWGDPCRADGRLAVYARGDLLLVLRRSPRAQRRTGRP